MDEQYVKLAIQYGEVLGRTSYDWVSTKIAQAKEKKKEEEKQIIYEEIINSLLQDKMELEMVAREYKDLYEKVTISDEDIEHLQNTVQRVVQLLSSSSPKVNENQQNIELLIQLVNKDTLKTMQLLGFNYKEAIGQPLTEVCATAIQRSFGVNKNPKQKSK
jgi:archaellum component FlaC